MQEKRATQCSLGKSKKKKETRTRENRRMETEHKRTTATGYGKDSEHATSSFWWKYNFAASFSFFFTFFLSISFSPVDQNEFGVQKWRVKRQIDRDDLVDPSGVKADASLALVAKCFSFFFSNRARRREQSSKYDQSQTLSRCERWMCG